MIRLALEQDINELMPLFEQAINDLKQQGIDQWQNGYPNQETILEDIAQKRAYVVEQDSIIAYYYLGEYEPNYNTIEGKWLSSSPYFVLHRVVVERQKQGLGIAMQLIESVVAQAKQLGYTIRIDTHYDNKAMQGLLKKCGFVHCGIIELDDGSKRLAYEKLTNT